MREIWHSDFLVETSVLGCAADDRRFYERLARQLHKMTSKPEYGRAWIPSTSLDEMAATPNPRRQEVLGVVLNLYRELGDRLLLTGTLDEIIAAEWAGPRHTVSRSFAHLESDLVTCARGNGAGTVIDEIGRSFIEHRTNRRIEYDKLTKKFRAAYARDERIGKAISSILEQPWSAEAFDICDDIAGQLIEKIAKRDKKGGLQDAKSQPEKYLATWTYAFLYRLAQFAQTIPVPERAKGSFGRYAKLLKANKNDLVDAELVSVGARCGFLITEDSNLRERIEFLYTRKVCRIQAFDFPFIETCWNPPNVARA